MLAVVCHRLGPEAHNKHGRKIQDRNCSLTDQTHKSIIDSDLSLAQSSDSARNEANFLDAKSLSKLMGNLCLSQAHYMQINDAFLPITKK